MRTINEELHQESEDLQEKVLESEQLSFLLNVLGWGWGDFEELIRRINKWDAFYQKNGLGNIGPDDLAEAVEDSYGKEGLADINSLFMVLFDRVFFEVLAELRARFDEDDDLLEALDALEGDYAPFINYLDSWFNNIFDEIMDDMNLSEVADLIKENMA